MTTGTPARAACQAASEPARPPPMMCTIGFIIPGWFPSGPRGPASGRRLFELGRSHVVALLVGADQLAAVPLGDLLGEERGTALGTRFGDRLVPEGVVALRVIGAAIEHLAATRLALHDIAAVLGADDSCGLVLDVLAGGVPRARRELAESPLLEHEVLAAHRAEFIEDLIRLRSGNTLLGRDDLPRRLALRVSRAGEEHAEPAAFGHHRLAAVLAGLLGLLGG